MATANHPLMGGVNVQGSAGTYKKNTSHGDRVNVRPAKASDVDYIRSLGKKVFHQYGPYEDILGGWFESSMTVTVLALMKVLPMGFAMVSLFRRASSPVRVAELLAIAVEPAKWRCGIGDLLMREIERKAKQLKVEKLILHTAAENLPGQKLFKKHGFMPSEIKKDFYPKGQDALMMCKSVTP